MKAESSATTTRIGFENAEVCADMAGPVWLSAAAAANYRSEGADTKEWGEASARDGYAAIWTPASRPSGFSRIASRSPTLATAST
jgi:hypothetical protein